MYRTPDNSDIPEWDGVEAEVADLVKTEEREASMARHPSGKAQREWDEAVDREIKVAEDAHLEAAYEERFEPLEMGEWYEEPWYETE